MLKRKQIVVMASGCYDPIHVGHLSLFKAAKALGDKLVVVVDNDAYLYKKKGYVFMPIKDRVKIISEFRSVDKVVMSDSEDVGNAILKIKPDIFALGGDVTNQNQLALREQEAVRKVGCKLVFGVGGGKIRSSSWFLNDWFDKKLELINIKK